MLGQKYPALSIFGHDQSEYLITLAKERARQLEGGAGAMPTFTVGDCRNVPYESQHFDFVMVMGNSFGYFSANDKQDDDEGTPQP